MGFSHPFCRVLYIFYCCGYTTKGFNRVNDVWSVWVVLTPVLVTSRCQIVCHADDYPKWVHLTCGWDVCTTCRPYMYGGGLGVPLHQTCAQKPPHCVCGMLYKGDTSGCPPCAFPKRPDAQFSKGLKDRRSGLLQAQFGIGSSGVQVNLPLTLNRGALHLF